MRKLSLFLGVLLLTTTALTLTAGVTGAAASTYQYSGKTSANPWLGVEGDISTDSESVPNDLGYHILNYVGLAQSGSCDSGACWIQAGNSLGATFSSGNPNYCYSTYVQAYMEEADVNNYDCVAYANTQIPLIQNDYYTTFYTWTCSGGDGLSDAYIYNGSAWTLIGQAWLPSCAGSSAVDALTEFLEGPGQTGFPTLGEYEYFGTNGSGGQSSGTILQQYNGSAWTPWTTSLQAGPNSPLNIFINGYQYDAFGTWG